MMRSEREGVYNWSRQSGHNCDVLTMYIAMYLAWNNIGDIGCRRLTASSWPQLNSCLFDAEVRVRGCQDLARAPWNQLNIFNLGTCLVIEETIRLARKAIPIFEAAI